MPFCTSCGSEQKESSRFCSVCGTETDFRRDETKLAVSQPSGQAVAPVTLESSTISTPANTATVSNSRTLRVVISILILISILIIQMVGIFDRQGLLPNTLTDIKGNFDYVQMWNSYFDSDLQVRLLTLSIFVSWTISPILIITSALYALIAKKANSVLPVVASTSLVLGWIVLGINDLRFGFAPDVINVVINVLLGLEGNLELVIVKVLSLGIFVLLLILTIAISLEKRKMQR